VRAGLRSGDRVVAVGERPVEDWVSFASAYAEAPAGAPVTLSVERAQGEYVPGAEREDETLALPVPALGDVHALGVEPATVLVSFVKPDGAAAAAGLEAGDLILAVDAKPVGSFASFAEGVRASEGRELQVTYARGGRTITTRVTPELVDDEAAGGRAQAYMVGIHAQDATLVGVVARDQELNPLRSIPRAAGMTWEITALTVQAVKKIVVGEIARNQIGGPIEIARQAHSALEAGWERYLNLLILISVNLAILNLLPIPVLDGGQAMLFAMEGIKRGPLSLRTREIAMQIGVTMVVLLMGFAFWNDLSRYWSSLVGWLRSLLTA
jgi:regulator of sigma E protease